LVTGYTFGGFVLSTHRIHDLSGKIVLFFRFFMDFDTAGPIHFFASGDIDWWLAFLWSI